MPVVAHVILHLTLCAAMAQASPQTSLAVRVRLADHHAVVRLDKTFAVQRGYDLEKIVEFDAPQGTWAMRIDTPVYGCSATSFQQVLPNVTRSIAQTLSSPAAPPLVPLLLGGTAPQSFLYVHPAFVLVNKNVACNQPVGDLVDAHTDVENDQDGFFQWMYADPPNNAPATIALQLRTPTHQYHYVRLPIAFPPPAGPWPQVVEFNVTQDELDSLATQPTDVLLCRRLFETRVDD